MLGHDEPNDSRKMVLNPDRWPRWPLLPLKRTNPKGGMPDCVTLADDPILGKFPVWEGTIFDGPLTGRKVIKVYQNVDELLADGWRVD